MGIRAERQRWEGQEVPSQQPKDEVSPPIFIHEGPKAQRNRKKRAVSAKMGKMGGTKDNHHRLFDLNSFYSTKCYSMESGKANNNENIKQK